MAVVNKQALKLGRQLYRSNKLAAVAGEDALAASLYPWFLLFGLDVSGSKGCFEYQPRAIHSELFYVFDGAVARNQVEAILALYVKHGLLIRYRDAAGREYGAWTNFRGWSKEQAGGKRRFPEPPGVHHTSEALNIPNEPSLLDLADGVEPRSEVPVVPDLPKEPEAEARPTRKPSGSVPDTAEIREVIDYYRAITKAPIRGYSEKYRSAVHHTLAKGDYDVGMLKAVMFLAMHGPHDWYRTHNHDLEYLIRPGVIEKILTQSASINLGLPSTEKLATEWDVFGILERLGFRRESPKAVAKLDPQRELIRTRLGEGIEARRRERARREAEAEATGLDLAALAPPL